MPDGLSIEMYWHGLFHDDTTSGLGNNWLLFVRAYATWSIGLGLCHFHGTSSCRIGYRTMPAVSFLMAMWSCIANIDRTDGGKLLWQLWVLGGNRLKQGGEPIKLCQSMFMMND